MSTSGKYIVSTGKLAEIIGKTAQRVNQLAQEGLLEKEAPGKWDLVKNARIYISYLENGRNKNSGNLETEKLAAEVRYKEAKATTAELELQELQGKMHRSEDVAHMTEDLVFSIRSAFVALPGRLATDVATLNTPAEVSERIRLEVNLALSNLSEYQYDPNKYRERVRQREGWDGNKAVDDYEE